MPPKRQSASKRQSSSKRTSAPKRSSAPATPSRGVKRKLEHADPPATEKEDVGAVIVQDGDEDVVVLPAKRLRTNADVPPPVAPASKKQQRQQQKKKKKKENGDEKETACTARRSAQQKTLDDFLEPPPSPLAQRAGNSLAAAAAAPTAPHDSLLPDALAALVPLHAALLTALLLHRAQNSSGVFPTFVALKPHVERLTGKRVTLDDVRRIVFLSHYPTTVATATATTAAPTTTSGSDSGLQLLDYGAGRIMVKFVDGPGSTPLTQHAALKQAFGRHARQFWHCRGTTDVPLAAIADHEHRATIKSVLHAKSQRLIRELRAVPVKAAAAAAIAAGGTKGGAGTKGGGGDGATAKARGTSLLERIRTKAAAAAVAAEDGPPSAAALVQRAAEGRVPEVTEILRGLRARGVSVGLHAAVDAVRASVRSPMSATEAEAALRLVGQREPWCAVREVGGVAAVVFGAFEGGGRFV